MPEPWFHVSSLPAAGSLIELDAREARHARGAQRLARGDIVVLFDGRGATARGEICEADRRQVCARSEAVVTHPEPCPALHLASALPKGDRLGQLLSMATQLGMSSFTPLRCRYSVARPGRGLHERFERIVRAACKQSRRPWAPELRDEQTPVALLATGASEGSGVVLDPEGAPARSLLALPAIREARALVLLVGPEAGFDPDERRALQRAGAHALAVSDGILRIETAAAAGLALLSQLRTG